MWKNPDISAAKNAYYFQKNSVFWKKPEHFTSEQQSSGSKHQLNLIKGLQMQKPRQHRKRSGAKEQRKKKN
jgi:hypothetical protein